MLRRLFGRSEGPDVAVPVSLLVAAVNDAGEEELLAYAPPDSAGPLFAAFTNRSELERFWHERGAASFEVVEKPTVELFEHTAKGAAGIVIDPLSPDAVALSRKDVRAWLKAPRATDERSQ